MKKLLILTFALSALIVSGCSSKPKTPPVSDIKDSHGCIVSSGNNWCEAQQKCLKTGESCEVVKINTYRNEDYGFELTLPDSWQGYSASTTAWHGQLVDGGSQKFQGPEVIIRNPKWTAKQPWQDLPIMIFTQADWKLVDNETLAVSAAPIGPSKLGENTKYVFATPPRWVGFTDTLGQDEAAEIVKTLKAF